VFGNAKLILDLLRAFGKYAALLPLVRDAISAIRAGDWVQVEALIAQLWAKIGMVPGGTVKFGAAPLGLAGPLPADVASALNELEAQCCPPDGASVG
jgi:hypothetical protein